MKLSVGIILVFVALIFLFTFPGGIKPASSIYGFLEFRGDPLGTMWWMWWYRYAWENGLDTNFVPIVAYPFEMSFRGLPVAPLLNYPAAMLNYIIGNEILTYNIFILGGIFLTALCMFLLVRYLTRSSSAGLLAGVIFGFCPNQLMHSGQHLGFTLNFWIPLYVLSLFRLIDIPSVKNALLCAISGACLVLTNYYYGYFMLIFTVAFLLFWRDKFKYFFWSGIIGFFILAPFVIPLLLRHGGGTVFAHPIGDLFKYSARWYDYFLPSEFHPIFGRCAQKISRHYFERSLYIGYVPLSLAVWAVGKGVKGLRSNGLQRVIQTPSGVQGSRVCFWALVAVVFFVFSLSPFFQIGTVRIPNFSFFAYRFLPMFRVYARMGFLVIFAVAVLAGYGLVGIRSRWIHGGFIVLVLFEYLNFPPFHNVDLSKTPDVYRWLANESADTVVVEYPFVRSIEAQHSEYLFYQRIHKKSLLNGASSGTIGDAFRREMYYPQALETAKLLAYLGADYMIVHKDFYPEEELKRIGENEGLGFVKDFSEARVYRVVAKPDELVIVYWQNFASPEKWGDGNYWRWMGNDATIWIGVKESKSVDIGFKILPFAKDRELEVSVNDVIIKRIWVDVVNEPSLARIEVLRDVLLKSGANIIRFYTPQGEDRIGDVLHNNDNRRVSFAISGFSIREAD